MSILIHELKTCAKYFNMVDKGTKRFEWRKFDRDFRVGDLLHLREWDEEEEDYTDRWQLVRIDCMLTYDEDGIIGIPKGYCIMGITLIGLVVK